MEKGLIIVYYGNGKGKTTASLGIALRGIGYNFKICMIQFIKGEWNYGEIYSSNLLKPNFELIIAGKGFVGILDDDHDLNEHIIASKNALTLAKEKINSLNYDTVILDEINYALKLNLIDEMEVLQMLKTKPYHVNVIMTGNYITEELLENADL